MPTTREAGQLNPQILEGLEWLARIGLAWLEWVARIGRIKVNWLLTEMPTTIVAGQLNPPIRECKPVLIFCQCQHSHLNVAVQFFVSFFFFSRVLLNFCIFYFYFVYFAHLILNGMSDISTRQCSLPGLFCFSRTFGFLYFLLFILRIWSSMGVWQLDAAVQSSWANELSGWAQERF